MAGNWETKRIADLGRVVTGKTPSTSVAENFGGNYPFITSPDMDGRREILTSARTLSEQGAHSLRTCRLPAGAVMMSCIATIGNCGITTRPSFTNQQINSLICGEDANPKFVYYSFRQLGHALEAAGGGGSVYTNVSKSRFEEIKLTLPPLAEQKRIAEVLGALDDKIELNRRMNATLEGTAQALFQSWFVDFDPSRAKLDGCQPSGMDPTTAAFFPNSFEESSLGKIPNGWRVGPVTEVTEFNRSSINPGDFPDETFDHFSLPAFDEGRTPKAELGGDIMSNKLVVTPDSVLLSKLNPHIPRIWLPDLHASRRSVCSTEFIVSSPRDGYSREFLFSLFTNSAFASNYGTLVTGTTGSHQRIRSESVLKMKTVIPPHKLVEAFTSIARPMFDQINRNIDQSRTLATLRDTLLPKLLSGELSVKEAA